MKFMIHFSFHRPWSSTDVPSLVIENFKYKLKAFVVKTVAEPRLQPSTPRGQGPFPSIVNGKGQERDRREGLWVTWR